MPCFTCGSLAQAVIRDDILPRHLVIALPRTVTFFSFPSQHVFFIVLNPKARGCLGGVFFGVRVTTEASRYACVGDKYEIACTLPWVCVDRVSWWSGATSGPLPSFVAASSLPFDFGVGSQCLYNSLKLHHHRYNALGLLCDLLCPELG